MSKSQAESFVVRFKVGGEPCESAFTEKWRAEAFVADCSAHQEAQLIPMYSRAPEETQEPRASERDVNMICGIVVCSFLDAPEKDRLCDLVRALAALPIQEAEK